MTQGWLLPPQNRPVDVPRWLAKQIPAAGVFAEAHQGILAAHQCADDCSAGHPGPYMQHGDYCEYLCVECSRTYPCPTVRYLAYGYRDAPGWQEKWAPEGTER